MERVRQLLEQSLAGRQTRSVALLDGVEFTDHTPSHTFTSVAAAVERAGAVVLATARSGYAADLAASVVRAGGAALDSARRSSVALEALHGSGAAFDRVLVLGPRAHHASAEFAPELGEHVFVAVPVYSCEFTGDEAPDLVELLRSRFVPTLDWQRGPSPRVYLAYDLADGERRSAARTPGLASWDRVRDLVAQMTELPGSHLELRNLWGRSVAVRRSASEFTVDLPGATRLHLDRPQTVEIHLWEFLTRAPVTATRAGTNPFSGASTPAAGNGSLSVYLRDAVRERLVEAEEPLSVSAARAVDEFDALGESPDSYIGFERDDGAVLQFAWNDDGTLDVDLPLAERCGSLAQTTDFATARALLQRFVAGDDVTTGSGLRFVTWA